MEKAGSIALNGILGCIGIRDEAPLMVGAGGDDQCVGYGVLTEELLNEAIEHVPEEAHGGAARYGAVMMKVHGEL